MRTFKLCLVYFFVIIFPLFGHDDPSSHPRVCLNMIVKNESSLITRCLESALPIIDYWVIVDTGSTDGTQEIIKQYMSSHEVPGELFERPWVNFSHNRNEALKLAKGKADYVLFIDADDYFRYEEDFKLPPLDKDFYYITISHGGTKYDRVHLINNHLNFEWRGVLHEVICSPPFAASGKLEKIVNVNTTSGARSQDPQKYLKDAQILEKGLIDEPNNSRYVFYLAQSYRDGGKPELAIENYERRVKMGGWDQEVFWSLFQIARLQEQLKKSPEIIINSYNRAFHYRRSRIEPLYYLARYYRELGDFQAGYATAKLGKDCKTPDDILFLEHWVYDYGLPLEMSVNAYWIGKYQECRDISLALLERNDLPNHIKECVEKNLGFAVGKLNEQQ